MSEKKEHRRRYNSKLEYVALFARWLAVEPPMWKLFTWHRWKAARPDPSQFWRNVEEDNDG